MNPQHSIAHDPCLCFSLPDRCPSHCFSELTFQRKPDPTGCQCHQWPPVLPCHSIPSLLLLGMHFSHSFLFSLPLSPGHGALGSLGAVCVWLSQIYSSSLVKWDTVTSCVSSGLHPRLLFGKCQIKSLGGEGEVTQWLVRRQTKNMSLLGTTGK